MTIRLRLLALAMAAALVSSGCSEVEAPQSAAGLATRPVKKNADPQMKSVLAAHAALHPKAIELLTPVEARRQPSASDAVFELLQERGDASPQKLPPVGRVETRAIPGPGGTQIPARIYTPQGTGPFPVVVYYHGGGWVIANVDTYDASCRALASMAGAIVVAVEYRRAPEAKFPAAPEDAYAAFQFVAANTSQFGGDPARVAVAGESAGGNLATVVCLMAKDRGGRMPIHQLLIYPVTDYGFDNESYRENANAKPLNAEMMRWFFKYYLTAPSDGTNKLVAPMRATESELRGMPPATVITAEIDPLRSEGMAYAARLKAAGVDVASRDYAGVTHEFFGMEAVLDKAKDAERFAADRLKQSFKTAG